MSRLREALNRNDSVEKEHWLTAERQSSEYAEALGLNDEDIKKMEDQNNMVKIALPHTGYVTIFAKYICTPFSDGGAAFGDNTPGWKRVLQARLEGDRGQYSTGIGTGFFTVLDQDLHVGVISALREERYSVEEKRIWP